MFDFRKALPTTYGSDWMGLRKYIPYPLRSMKISLDFCPFAFWWMPMFIDRGLSEARRTEGDVLWYARWLCFQISYSRLV